MNVKSDSLIRIGLGTAFILLMIMVANRIYDDVNWNVGDFIAMGVLLLSAGLGFEILATKLKSTGHRVAVAVAIGTLFLLIWVELAVGLFGSPFAGS